MNEIIYCIINSLIYVIIHLMIKKRKKYTSIAIRSPYILYFNNFFTLILTTILIFSELKKQFIFQLIINQSQILIMISYFLMCQRIVISSKINPDERSDIELFYNKNYLYQENYYIKILFYITIILSIFHIVIYFFHQFSIFQFDNYINDYIIFLIFFEILFLITYTYKILNEELLKFQIICLILIWTTYLNLKKHLDENLQYYFFFIIIYCNTFLTNILPILMTYLCKSNITFQFNPKLMNDLYLFLLDEECYKMFSNYINLNDANNFIYLTIYTHIMKLKFLYDLENNQSIINNEARIIYELYFEKNDYKLKFNEEIFEKIREKYNNLNNKNPTNDLFDDALEFCFIEIGKMFEKVRKSYEYQLLSDSIHSYSYIHCKMSNVEMINKY